MPGLVPSIKISDLHCLTSRIKYEQCLKHYDNSENACLHLKAVLNECLNDKNIAVAAHHKLRRSTITTNTQ